MKKEVAKLRPTRDILVLWLVFLWPIGVYKALRRRPHWFQRASFVAILSLYAFVSSLFVVAITKAATSPPPITATATTTKVVAIKFSVQKVDDPTMNTGQQQVTQPGRDGQKSMTYTVTTQDGKEISRKEVSETVTKEPVTQIVHVGTNVPAPQPSTNSSASSPSSSSSSAAAPADVNNLPLKAICNDGTVSYQDDPSGTDYRGMCSGHKGIQTKLGRVP